MKLLIGSLVLAAAVTLSAHAFALAGLNGRGLNLARLHGTLTTAASAVQVNLNSLQIECIELAH